MYGPDGRDRLYIRLGKNKRDRRLAVYITADIEQGTNVSQLVKELLYNYYTGAAVPHHTKPTIPQRREENRQSALSSKLKRLKFSGLQ